MPRVPTYDNYQTTPGILQGQVSAPKPINAMPEQMQQLGQNMQQAGGQMGKIALDAQQQANQLRVDDAINQAKEAALKLTYDKDAGYTNLRGIDALQRSSGKPMAEEYTDNLREQMRGINDTLGNDAQKAQFRAQTQSLVGNFWADATKHESDQFRDYALSVRDGTISTRSREIALNYRNPEAVDQAVQSIRAATYDQARLLGKSAEWADAQAIKAASGAHTTAIMSALQDGDTGYAQAYMAKYASQMDPDDLLKLHGQISDQVDAKLAYTAAQDVMQQVGPQMHTSSGDRLFNIMIGTESGGRQFDSTGQPLASSKGAIGIAQVMPSTAPEAAKIAGVPWDENRYKTDPSYNAALGRAYFGKQLQDFGGDPSKAMAAYNAGPGAVSNAMRAAAIDKSSDWLSYLPKETQDYVAKNMKAYAAGQGQYSRPSLNQVMQQVAATVGTDNPKRLKLAQDEAKRQYDLMTADIKQRSDDAVANAMRQLETNGGSFAQLPADVRAAIPPDKVTTLMDYGARVSRGDDTTNPALYQKLATDQQYLTDIGDSEFYALRAQLSQSDFKKFADERGRLRVAAGKAPGGKSASDAETLNTTALNNVLADRFRMMGWDPSPKDGSAEAARQGAIRKFIRDGMLDAQQVTGKKMNDADVEGYIDQLFSKTANKSTWFGLGSENMRLLGMTASNIDSTTKDQIKAAYAKAGIDSPTDADILGAYWRMQTQTMRAR